MTDPDAVTYATMPQLIQQIGRTDEGAPNDALLQLALVGASRAIEQWCGGRQFWLADTASTRTYIPDSSDYLAVDDIGSLDDLAVSIGVAGVYTPLDASAYEPSPLNALAAGRPVTSLVDVLGYNLWRPHYQHQHHHRRVRVQVTARWGWPVTPDAIASATLLTAARLYRRKGSPEGVAGFGDLGVVRVSQFDADVQALIGPYRRLVMA